MPRVKRTIPYGPRSMYYKRALHELAGGHAINKIEQEGWYKHRQLLDKATKFPEGEVPEPLVKAILEAEQEAKRRKSAFDLTNQLKKAMVANADYAASLEMELARTRAQLDSKNGVDVVAEAKNIPLTVYALDDELDEGSVHVGKTVLDIIIEDPNYITINLDSLFQLDEKAMTVYKQFIN